MPSLCFTVNAGPSLLLHAYLHTTWALVSPLRTHAAHFSNYDLCPSVHCTYAPSVRQLLPESSSVRTPDTPYRERRPRAAPHGSVDTKDCLEIHNSYGTYISLTTSIKQFPPAFIKTVSWHATSLIPAFSMHTDHWHA